jgi:hypothetical protein
MKLIYQQQLLKHSTKCIMIILACVSSISLANANENKNGLAVSPKRCVALRQGQICYQEVTFKWQQSQVGNYCLVELPTQEVLKCWQQVQTGTFDFDFQYNQSTSFALREQGLEQNLSVVPITVSWVFKSSRRPKSSWKLF